MGSKAGCLQGSSVPGGGGLRLTAGQTGVYFVGVGRWCGSGVLCEEGQNSGRQAAQSRNVLKGEPGLSGLQSVCLGPPELERWKLGRRVGVRGKSP